MTEPISNPDLHSWYARPVLFVSDVRAALRFYVDQLAFVKAWHSKDGKGTVCQVNRGSCELILCQDDKRRDKSRLFVELNREQLADLRRLITERSISHDYTWWGYDVIRILDPDGNELLIPTEGQ